MVRKLSSVVVSALVALGSVWASEEPNMTVIEGHMEGMLPHLCAGQLVAKHPRLHAFALGLSSYYETNGNPTGQFGLSISIEGAVRELEKALSRKQILSLAENLKLEADDHSSFMLAHSPEVLAVQDWVLRLKTIALLLEPERSVRDLLDWQKRLAEEGSTLAVVEAERRVLEFLIFNCDADYRRNGVILARYLALPEPNLRKAAFLSMSVDGLSVDASDLLGQAELNLQVLRTNYLIASDGAFIETTGDSAPRSAKRFAQLARRAELARSKLNELKGILQP